MRTVKLPTPAPNPYWRNWRPWEKRKQPLQQRKLRQLQPGRRLQRIQRDDPLVGLTGQLRIQALLHRARTLPQSVDFNVLCRHGMPRSTDAITRRPPGGGRRFKHAFNYHCESTCIGKGKRIAHDCVRFLFAAPAYTITAKNIDCLRGQTDMCHDRNSA